MKRNGESTLPCGAPDVRQENAEDSARWRQDKAWQEMAAVVGIKGEYYFIITLLSQT